MLSFAVIVCCAILAAGLIWSARLRRPLARTPGLPQADLPRPFGYKMSWLAVRTRDTAQLIEALQVRDVQRAGWSDGIAAIYADEPGRQTIFVTPPVDGWSFVAGLSLPHPLGPAFYDKLTPLLARLSATFGDAHYHFTFPLLDFYAWAKATDGKVVRAFATGDEGIIWNRGRLTPEERQLKLRFFELRGIDSRIGDVGGDMHLVPTEEQVLKLAGMWSIDPSTLSANETDTAAFGYLGSAPAAWRSQRQQKSAA